MNYITHFLKEFQDFILHVCRVIRSIPYVREIRHDLVEQMDSIGLGSLMIVILTGLFTGFVLALQASVELSNLGALSLVGQAVSISVTRELGPVLVALMVAARSGSAMTAELASMRITEQIDALIVEGGNSVKDLILPRFMASIIMIPLLTIIGCAAAFLGGHIIAVFYFKVSPFFYWNSVFEILKISHLWGGLIKAIVFSGFIALICCYVGLTTKPGVKGLGEATTRAVVFSAVIILATDFLLTRIFIGTLW